MSVRRLCRYRHKRRTFAGDLIERTDLVNVQRLMGHSFPPPAQLAMTAGPSEPGGPRPSRFTFRTCAAAVDSYREGPIQKARPFLAKWPAIEREVGGADAEWSP